jgi:hypothetical protein
MQRGRLQLLLIPFAALIPILPLLIHGCSCGHDFDFHILNWLEAARQFSHGNLHPQWAYSAAWNAGEPRFVFYPPLSWSLGALLGLLLPWAWTPIVYTWLVLTAAGFSLHRLARTFTGPTAALLAAIFYLVNPYTLFTAYERTAYAELLAAVWIPLLLQAILQEQVTLPAIAAPVALLWLTNAPAAVMSCYALALLTVVRIILDHRDRLRIALTTAAGTALGLGLAAFYLVPAAVERRYVQISMAILPGLRFQDNFLFHHTTAGITNPADLNEAILHDKVLHTASVIALILLTLTTIALCFIRLTSSGRVSRPSQPSREGSHAIPPTSLIYALTTLTLTIALLLTPLSTPLWKHIPQLAFLQFPWRLLALLAATLAMALALALRKLSLQPVPTFLAALTIAAILTYPAYTRFQQACDAQNTVARRTALFHSNQGSEPTDEYTPTNADNDLLAHANPPYWISSTSQSPAPASAQPGSTPTHLSLHITQPEYLILNLRDYGLWNITTNDPNSQQLNHPNHTPRDDGLIAIPLPTAADYTIDITPTRTLDQTVGAIVTALSMAILAVFHFKTRTI